MCIGGTPYVCSHIIVLSTPIITDVTKIAHQERVPNGALPKLGRVLTPLWGRTTPSSKKRRLRWRCASLLCHHENMLLPWVVLVWQTLYCKELLAKQDIIAHWYYWTRLLAKFIVIFYIWCSYSIVAYVHLLLRLQLQHLPPSAYNYIDYSSAVDLVALRVYLVCKYRASSDTYRSTLQSPSFIDSGCYHYW